MFNSAYKKIKSRKKDKKFKSITMNVTTDNFKTLEKRHTVDDCRYIDVYQKVFIFC